MDCGSKAIHTKYVGIDLFKNVFVECIVDVVFVGRFGSHHLFILVVCKVLVDNWWQGVNGEFGCE